MFKQFRIAPPIIWQICPESIHHPPFKGDSETKMLYFPLTGAINEGWGLVTADGWGPMAW